MIKVVLYCTTVVEQCKSTTKSRKCKKIMFLSVGMSEHEAQVEPGAGHEVVLRIGKVEQVV